MRRLSRTSSGRLIHRFQSPLPIMDVIQDENVLGEPNPRIDQGDNNSQHNALDQNQQRTLRDYMNPTRQNRSIVAYSISSRSISIQL